MISATAENRALASSAADGERQRGDREYLHWNRARRGLVKWPEPLSYNLACAKIGCLLRSFMSNVARPTLDITLRWHDLGDDDDPRWRYSRALYAYLSPRSLEILYIGKADGCSVRGRWRQKQIFWRDLEKERGIFNHTVIVAEMEADCRMTRQLLADVESLLIYEVEPWGNIQCQKSRISRTGLKVECRGAWPLSRRVFRDV